MSQCFALPVPNLWKDSMANKITQYKEKEKAANDKQAAIKNWKIVKSEFESGLTTTTSGSFTTSRFTSTF